QLTDWRLVTSGHFSLNPVVRAHIVEGDAGWSIDQIRRRIARSLDISLERVVHRLEIGIRLVFGVILVKEVVGIVGTVGLAGQKVNRRQAEALRELQDG